MTIAAPANNENATNKETRLWVFMNVSPISLFSLYTLVQQSCTGSVYGVTQEENETIERAYHKCDCAAHVSVHWMRDGVFAKKVGQGPLEFYARLMPVHAIADAQAITDHRLKRIIGPM